MTLISASTATVHEKAYTMELDTGTCNNLTFQCSFTELGQPDYQMPKAKYNSAYKH